MNNHDEMLLRSMTALVSAHSKAISRFGANVVVMTKFVEAVLPQLSRAQMELTMQTFRAQIDEAMAAADAEAGAGVLPGEYRATLIEQADVLLARLGGARASRSPCSPCAN
ncbi:hypothetical protein [Paraburkholderia sp. J41]|uniref:hypothetical protein n=1 Tax=Paraburkholderia sp. J41 TaxID=2805433 RepID=UPI002AC36019|nr:hypothetical protein [Paraburkholderia sp. J41]